MKRTNTHSQTKQINTHTHIGIFSFALRIHSFIWITKQANVDFLRFDSAWNDGLGVRKIKHKNRFNSTHFKNKDMCTALKALQRGNGERWRETRMSMGWFLNTGQIVNYSFRFVIFAERHAGVKASLRIYFWLFLCVFAFFISGSGDGGGNSTLFWICSSNCFSSHPNCKVDLLQVLDSSFFCCSTLALDMLPSILTWRSERYLSMSFWIQINWTKLPLLWLAMLQLQVHIYTTTTYSIQSIALMFSSPQSNREWRKKSNR